MSISETTRKLYGSHAKRFERWLDKRGKEGNQPDNWVCALQELTTNLSKKSWRLYRNAVTWHLRETYGDRFAGQFLMMTDRVEKPPTRARKLVRHVEPGILEIIVGALIKRRGERAKRIADLMISMVVTGLRQSEFGTAEFVVGDQLMLVVRNAKFRLPTSSVPGRGNGPTRELILSKDAPTGLVGSIARTIDWCSGRKWSSMGPNVNRTFRTVIRELVRSRRIGARWEKLRLYDCRHQFSANAKWHLSLLSGEVAAAMGHRSAVTAISHYGKRKKARSTTSLVQPSERSVAAVSESSLAKVKTIISRSEMSRTAAKTQTKPNPVANAVERITFQPDQPGTRI